MKKLISILLLLALVFTLCACRRKDGKDDNDEKENTSDYGNQTPDNSEQPENPFNNNSGIETPIIPLD